MRGTLQIPLVFCLFLDKHLAALHLTLKKDKATQLQKQVGRLQKVGNRASTKEKQDEESGNTGSFNFNFAFELVVAHYQKS